MLGCSMQLTILSVSCKISVASSWHRQMLDVLGMTSFAMSVPYLSLSHYCLEESRFFNDDYLFILLMPGFS